MRINEYNCMEEFVEQYSTGLHWPSENHYIGIEFRYNGRYYRMCAEPTEDFYTVYLPNGKIGKYDVMEMICEKRKYPGSDRYQLIGWFSDFDDLMANCVIDGKPFREVIMDDNTEILGQD